MYIKKKRTKEQICAERFPDSKAIPKQCTLHHFKHKTTALYAFLQGPSFMKHEVHSITVRLSPGIPKWTTSSCCKICVRWTTVLLLPC